MMYYTLGFIYQCFRKLVAMNHTVIYPGTFDPITNGHTDLIMRACRLFNRVIVAVAGSTNKNTVFSLDQRVELIRTTLGDQQGIEVQGFQGLLIDFAAKCGAKVVLRGLRAFSDFEYEFQLASMNRRLDASIETVFLTPSEQNGYISSSLVREIAALGGDVTPFVSSYVVEALRLQYQKVK